MVKEFSESLIAVAKDRLVSPLPGLFIISWLAWNYQLLMVIAFVEGYQARVDEIGKLYPAWQEHVLHWLLIPGAFAVGLLFAYPAARNWAERKWAQFEIERKKAQIAASRLTPKTQEDVDGLIDLYEKEVTRIRAGTEDNLKRMREIRESEQRLISELQLAQGEKSSLAINLAEKSEALEKRENDYKALAAIKAVSNRAHRLVLQALLESQFRDLAIDFDAMDFDGNKDGKIRRFLTRHQSEFQPHIVQEMMSELFGAREVSLETLAPNEKDADRLLAKVRFVALLCVFGWVIPDESKLVYKLTEQGKAGLGNHFGG